MAIRYTSNFLIQNKSHRISANSGFYSHIHAFRGLSILQIVFLHAFSMTFDIYLPLEGDNSAAIAKNTLQKAFHGSTLYFSLASGLIYCTVLSSWSIRRFYISRFQFLFVPFVIISLIGSLYSFDKQNFYISQFTSPNYPAELLYNLLDGNARVHLWYVPVLLCILALSPVYLDICRNRPWLAAAIILLPLISSRAGTQFSIRNVMYFGGAYATGMLVGLHFQRLIKFFSPRMLMLLAAAAVSITLLITVAEMQGFPRLVERAYYLQKLMIGLLLLLVLFRLYDGKTVPRFIDYFAASSYAVYLLHFFAIEITLAALAFAVPPQRSTLNALSIGIVCFAVSLLLTALAVRIGTKLFGRYSKLIIGA